MADRRIEVAKPPIRPHRAKDIDRFLAEFCWHYPQYTLAQARRLSFKSVNLLIQEARRQEAMKMYNLTNIAAAPQTKKMVGVKKLLAHFKKLGEA